MPTIDSLLSLFSDLHLEGVSGHEYVDYLFCKYQIPNLNLSEEIVKEQINNLTKMKNDQKTKAEFRLHLLRIKAKLKEYRSWAAMRYVNLNDRSLNIK